MSDDGLFDLPDAGPPSTPDRSPSSEQVPDWQIAQLRTGLDGLGLGDGDERQQLVQRLVGRPVSALRDLTYSEARTLGEQIAAMKRESMQRQSRSSWDEREGETWIDRL